MGKHIDVVSGKWTETASAIGSNVDSFYEYLLKGYELFDDEPLWFMFMDQYNSVHTYQKYNDWYQQVDMNSGKSKSRDFENLAAFWPGLETDIGHVDDACGNLNALHYLWNQNR